MIRPIMMRTTIVGDDKGRPRKLRAIAVGAPTILQITMLETTADAIAVRVRVAQHRLHLRRRTIMVTMASDTVNPDLSELGKRRSAVPALLGPLPFSARAQSASGKFIEVKSRLTASGVSPRGILRCGIL